MSEKFPMETAKKPADLDDTYKKVKAAAKDYGFTSVAELKSDVVKKAMTDSKKAAEFVVEVDIDQAMMVQLFCEVKGKMRSVLGRSQITSVEQFKAARALAKNGNLKKASEGMFGL